MIIAGPEGIPVDIKICNLCSTCGFVDGSERGVLKGELGFNKIVENQIVFPCHEHLEAFNGTQNTGTCEMAKEKGKLYVCSGYIQCLKKSGIKPKNKLLESLYDEVKDIDKRIMTLSETKDYHGIK